MERLKCDQTTDSKAGRRHDKAGFETDMAQRASEGFKTAHVIKEALRKDRSSCPAEKSMERVISGCHETS